MKSDVTGAVWPEYHVKFEKTYAAGEIVTFWMYVEVDPSLAGSKTFGLEAFNLLTGTRCEVVNNGYPYNTWVQAQVKLANDTEYLRFYTNFDHRNQGASVFGNASVTLYMDNFCVIDDAGADTMTVTQDGTIKLLNVDADNESRFVYRQGIKMGDTVSFHLDINSTEKVMVSVLDDEGVMKYNTTFDRWSGMRTIAFTADSDAEFMTICVQYGGSDLANRVSTISDLQVSSFVVEQDKGGYGTLH